LPSRTIGKYMKIKDRCHSYPSRKREVPLRSLWLLSSLVLAQN
jgi:hypothetical protein